MTIVSSLSHPHPHIVIVDRYPTQALCEHEIMFLERELKAILVYKQMVKFTCRPVKQQTLILRKEGDAYEDVSGREK